MNYENKEKLSKVLSEIINSENAILVAENKSIQLWKDNNLSKIRNYDSFILKNELLQKRIDMLNWNIKKFMESIWASYHDESWQDWDDHWGCWWEEIIFWKFQDKELSLTSNQVPVVEEKKEPLLTIPVDQVPF